MPSSRQATTTATRSGQRAGDRPQEISLTETAATDAPRTLTDAELAAAIGGGMTAGAAIRPTMAPPGAAGVAATAAMGTAGAVGTWATGQQVAALWTNRSARNAYALIAGGAWKRFNPTSDSSVLAMTMLASSAKDTGSRFDYREEADGLIHEIYLW